MEDFCDDAERVVALLKRILARIEEPKKSGDK